MKLNNQWMALWIFTWSNILSTYTMEQEAKKAQMKNTFYAFLHNLIFPTALETRITCTTVKIEKSITTISSSSLHICSGCFCAYNEVAYGCFAALAYLQCGTGWGRLWVWWAFCHSSPSLLRYLAVSIFLAARLSRAADPIYSSKKLFFPFQPELTIAYPEYP